MAAWQTVLVISTLGFGSLGAKHFCLPLQGRAVAVIVPPWQPGGMAFADAVGLPPLDIRWAGRLVVFPPSHDPIPLTRMGFFVLPADGTAGCIWSGDRNGAVG